MRNTGSLPISLIAAAITLSFAAPASALPVGSALDQDESLRETPTWEELDAAGVDFTAIVALSNCSGSLSRPSVVTV